MTNSIASAKCQSVLTSGNYGMSQNHCTDESKEYIFVKLTDSAHRAIEEYQRHENAKRFTAIGQHSQQPVCRPKIQFIGNSGFIQFPALDSSNGGGGGNGADGGRKFGFTIDDVEGSLECLRQTPSGLDVLGALSHRIRIHANDDIYDTTRTKMAIAEETEKSKCIREIKPDQNDIGRKVKKPLSSSSLHQHHHQHHNGNNNSNNSSSSNYLSNSNNRSKFTSSLSGNSPPLSGSTNGSKLSNSSSGAARSPNPTLLGGSGTIANNSSSSRYGSHTSSSSASSNLYSQNNASSSLPSLTSASSLSSTLAGGITNGYASASTGSSPNAATDTSALSKSKMGSGNTNYAAGGMRGSGSLAKGGGSKAAGSSNSSGSSKLPDIAKRKIRERLIHLLALKPFKKPELYSRLQNEGLRDRERALIGSILKDISVIARDNTYNIRRTVWNDVNENWPYYTEQELQQLKRRKPQNLTPPLSSDAGSSTSGQSPTSHTGSPPPLVSGGGGLGDGGSSGLKRASLENDDSMLLSGAQPKKQRISHFKKDALSTGTVAPTSSTGFLGSGAVQRTSGGYASGTSRNSIYSPHGSQNSNSGVPVPNDENSANSDLSYNVLDSEDFMTHIEQSNSYYGNNTRKPSASSGANSKLGNTKEKRNSSSNNGSNNSAYNSQQERRSNKDLLKKSSSSSSVSRTPPSYNVSFVPESKSSSRGSANGQQRQSPNYSNPAPASPSLQQQPPQQQHHKMNNSVIYSTNNNSSKGQASSQDEPNAQRASGSASRHAQSPAAMGRAAKKMSPAKQLQQQPQPHAHHNHPQQQQQQQQQQHQSQPPMSPSSQQQQQPQPPQQHNSFSPTQQIAAAVSSYATSSDAEKPHYDFSNYTPITSIERRRQYKTEFERDFDEYRHLLARIDTVGKHFCVLAEQLENARQGCTDYFNIRQQIISEYERISSEEALKRDKERFDYLHAKLAHIKQLVADYDKTLTSGAGAAVAAAAAMQRQYKQETETSRNNFRLSPMMVSGGESNNSPPSATYHHRLQQQQQEQHSHYQEHHDAETIERHQQNHLRTAQFPTPPAQYPPSPVVNNAVIEEQQSQYQNYNGHSLCDPESENQHQRQEHHNNDTDTDDSSDSNSDDDNEDDDDDDSNSNSNDDDDDDNDHTDFC